MATAFEKEAPGIHVLEFSATLAGGRGRNPILEFMRKLATAFGKRRAPGIPVLEFKS